MAGVVAGRALGGHVRRRQRAFRPRPIRAIPGPVDPCRRNQRDGGLRALFLAFPIVGALVAFGRPQNPIGWILLADGLLWMLLAVTDSYDLYGVSSPGSVPFPVTVGALGNIWLWVPTVGLLGTYLLLLFPDGKLPSKRWRPLAVFSGVVIVLFSVAEGLAPGLLENQGGVQNRSGSRRSPGWWVRRTTSSRCCPFASLLRR
jgi:hypothetical protein